MCLALPFIRMMRRFVAIARPAAHPAAGARRLCAANRFKCPIEACARAPAALTTLALQHAFRPAAFFAESAFVARPSAGRDG
ncbi:exported hypothetical protein [Sinorhizobium medicae]|uniref:Uncharacterized protein n=1 Tax=Sinorhizobium medicae TaxID=110321 RepID=A0A508WSU2_9HYPH|nr:exported hypothetical protein [Sinorhizobium medicae]